MFKLYDKLQNLRCPSCNAVQSAFQLRLTFKHIFNGFAANAWTMCPACQTKLKLAARFNLFTTFVLTMMSAILFVVVCFLPLLVGFVGLSQVSGYLALLFSPLFVFAYFFANAFWARLMSPLYREVTVI